MADLIDSYGNPINSPNPKDKWWKRTGVWLKKNRKEIVTFILGGGLIATLNFIGIKDLGNVFALFKAEKNCFAKVPRYKVLLLPFHSYELGERNLHDVQIGRMIRSRLLSLSEKGNLGLQVCLDTTRFGDVGFEEARMIGSKLGADLVIWGDLFKRRSRDDRAQLKYTVIKPLHRVKRTGESELEVIAEPSDIMEGQLQRDVDYVIFWTLAFEASSRNKCDKAEAYFNNIVNKFPEKTSEAYYTLAQCHYDNDEFKLSINYYDRVIKYNPEHAVSYSNRGLAKLSLNDYVGANSDIIQAIILNPQRAMAYNSLGAIFSRMRNYRGSIVHYNKAIELNPEYAPSYYNRGLSKSHLGDLEGAINDYSKAIELNTEYAPSYNGRGIAKGRLGKSNDAINDFTKAINIDLKYADAYVNRGIEKCNVADHKGAIHDFTKAIKLQPKDLTSFFNRGIARIDYHDFEGAIADFSEVIQLDLKHTRSYYHRGLVRFHLGHFELADADFSKAIQLDSNYADAIKSIKRDASKVQTDKQRLFPY